MSSANVFNCFRPMDSGNPRESAGEIVELMAWLERDAKCKLLLFAVALAGRIYRVLIVQRSFMACCMFHCQ